MNCECCGTRAHTETSTTRSRNRFLELLSIGFASVIAFSATVALGVASAQTVATDLPDYPPGATAQITGSGFWPNEVVTLQVTHIDGTPDGGAGHEPWTVTADGNGALITTWYVDPDDSAYSTFLLTATGQARV